MKKIITLLFCVVSFTLINAQTNADLSVDHLEKQQAKAIENKNYDAAAKYEKAIELKDRLDKAVLAEDWDKAADVKKELNDINFKGSYKNMDQGYYSSNGLREVYDREFMESGFFLDGMVGVGTFGNSLVSNGPSLALNMQFGSKWHFGKSKVYRPGIQLTWLRFGLQKALTNTDFSVHMYPINIGYASIIGFTDELGMEVNLNFGAGLNFNLEEFPFDYGVHAGVHVNPNIKFRYNQLAVGFDVSTLNGPILTSGSSSWYSSNMYSITVGGVF